MLFDSVVRGIMLYGTVEIYKMSFGLDVSTPTYIVLEEVKIGEIWIKAGKRAVRFEENSRTIRDKVISKQNV